MKKYKTVNRHAEDILEDLAPTTIISDASVPGESADIPAPSLPIAPLDIFIVGDTKRKGGGKRYECVPLQKALVLSNRELSTKDGQARLVAWKNQCMREVEVMPDERESVKSGTETR